MSTPRRRGEIPAGRSVEEALEEFEPRAQAFVDARRRAVLRALDIEADLLAMRKSARRPKPILKEFIEAFVARHPDVTGRALAIALDNSPHRPRKEWTKASGKRLWFELWDDEAHPKTQRAVQKYVYAAAKLSLRVTGDNLPDPREGA
jgi:hypothetical protein